MNAYRFIATLFVGIMAIAIVVGGATVASRSDGMRMRSPSLVTASGAAVVDAPEWPRNDLFVLRGSSSRLLAQIRRRKRGAIYARFSTRYQASIEDQVRACREWAAANDVDVEDEMIFLDEAVSGKKSSRIGLNKLKGALAAGKIDVLIAFATNRLHRNSYKARQFIEEEVIENQARCVCIRSGVDTADTKKWKLLHGVNSIVDEVMLQGTADQVREAHAGLLLNRKVCGTITYGYTGQEIPGAKTRMMRPQRLIVIDPVTSRWVRVIFDWFLISGFSITDITAKLAHQGAPPAPRCVDGWTELAVRRILSNRRYIGLWSYGDTKTIWLNKKDYGRQFKQEQPLQSKHFEELRIIDDVTFAKAQERLGRRNWVGGRKSADGNHRPRILNGLLWCPEHDRPLVHGAGFYCPKCRRSESPALFSKLPAKLAVTYTCEKLAELVTADSDLVCKIIAAFRSHVESLQRPDLTRLPDWEHQEERLTKHINLILRNPGESPEDEAESEATLKKLRGERAAIYSKIADLKQLAAQPASIPSPEDCEAAVASIRESLEAAASGRDPADAQTLRQIIIDLTGGRIICSQQGLAKAKQGWIRGTFRIHLLQAFAKGAILDDSEGSEPNTEETFVDFHEPLAIEERADEVKAMVDRGLMMAEIALKLGVHRNQVTFALQHWYTTRGLTAPDGRTRRSTLEKKHLSAPLYQAIADRVMELCKQGKLLYSVATELGVDRNTITQAIDWWHRSRGLPAPDGRTRRKTLEHKSMPHEPPTGQCLPPSNEDNAQHAA